MSLVEGVKSDPLSVPEPLTVSRTEASSHGPASHRDGPPMPTNQSALGAAIVTK